MSTPEVASMRAMVQAFPELLPVEHEHLKDNDGEMLPYLFLPDIIRWMAANMHTQPDRCRAMLDWMEVEYVNGPEIVENLLVVSGVEMLPYPWEPGSKLREWLGPSLQRYNPWFGDSDARFGLSIAEFEEPNRLGFLMVDTALEALGKLPILNNLHFRFQEHLKGCPNWRLEKSGVAPLWLLYKGDEVEIGLGDHRGLFSFTTGNPFVVEAQKPLQDVFRSRITYVTQGSAIRIELCLPDKAEPWADFTLFGPTKKEDRGVVKYEPYAE